MRYIFFTFILIFSILILKINITLHAGNFTPEEKRSDIIYQLNFLETELKYNNLGVRMQSMYPEGYVFINALYGLSWCELALSDLNNDLPLKEKAINEALFAYNNINSEFAQRTFDNSLIPKNGIYYFGWKNYLLSKILSVDTTFNNHKSYIGSFANQCELIHSLLQGNKNPYLQSYSGQSWPADMFVTMASLSNYDKIFKPKYEDVIKDWILKVKERLDPKTHLIPHYVDSETGKSVQGARGSSMSLILRMLAEINAGFASEQFKLFKTNFVTTTFGLPSLREYPKDQDGYGDIDSGPVILGVGFSGTIVMIGTFSMFDCDYLAERQYKTINAFGFETTSNNQKKYLLGMFPIADAFIAWGRATELKYQDSIKNDPGNWSIKFHCISLFILLFLWIVYFRKQIIIKIKTDINNR